MSEYSVCFQTGMSGNCGVECEDFQAGLCEHAEPIDIPNEYRDRYGLPPRKQLIPVIEV